MQDEPWCCRESEKTPVVLQYTTASPFALSSYFFESCEHAAKLLHSGPQLCMPPYLQRHNSDLIRSNAAVARLNFKS